MFTVVTVFCGSWIVALIEAEPPPRPEPPTAAGTGDRGEPFQGREDRRERLIRTYRRSAEDDGVTKSCTPLGKGVGCGRKPTEPGPMIGVSDDTCRWFPC